ncbi:twinfilin-2-B-like [Carcharodon carcharias]|uniref:twinfilin-2-B-like n=1 Tax=Carcharodon carcharias TaxID=13397 RepID=UPI001B7F3F42|nr:twinfilin-2-B-like [Carcharodon carcharias]
MSHQTGISVSPDLQRVFSQSKDGSVRLIQVLIENELLVPGERRKPGLAWDQDYDELVLPLLSKTQPCYLLYCLDSRNAQGLEWIFISWTPEISSVRQKMLYTATRATLKKEFGGGHIKDEISATLLEDITLSGYRNHLASDAAPPPLTAAEQELQQLKINEVTHHPPTTHRLVTVPFCLCLCIQLPPLSLFEDNVSEGNIYAIQTVVITEEALQTCTIYGEGVGCAFNWRSEDSPGRGTEFPCEGDRVLTGFVTAIDDVGAE